MTKLKIRPSKSAKNRNLFRKAADVLRRGHWMRNDWFQRDKPGDNMLGSYCLTGAILKAEAIEKGHDKALTDPEPNYDHTPWYQELEEVLGQPPEGWNDEIAKSKHEVIKVLEELAGDES